MERYDSLLSLNEFYFSFYIFLSRKEIRLQLVNHFVNKEYKNKNFLPGEFTGKMIRFVSYLIRTIFFTCSHFNTVSNVRKNKQKTKNQKKKKKKRNEKVRVVFGLSL